MAASVSKEQLQAIVTHDYVRDNLPAALRERIDSPLDFGDGLVSATYADWIVENAKVFYFILAQIRVPHRIFDVIDHALDDGDLPLQSNELARLSIQGEEVGHFIRAQAQLSAKAALPRLGQDDQPQAKLAIEVLPSSNKSKFMPFGSSSELVDTVRIVGCKSRVFTRRCIFLSTGNTGQGGTPRDSFMQDIQMIKRISHQHLVALRTAYFARNNCGYVLLSPTLNVPLRSLFNKQPKTFRLQPQAKQLEHLFNWPHCLASALYFLHRHGLHHGKILPSNIFIDNWNRIYLGFSVFTPSIQCQSTKDIGKQGYNYGAPEIYNPMLSTQWHPPKRYLPNARLRETSPTPIEPRDSRNSLASILNPEVHGRPTYTEPPPYNSKPGSPSFSDIQSIRSTSSLPAYPSTGQSSLSSLPTFGSASRASFSSSVSPHSTSGASSIYAYQPPPPVSSPLSASVASTESTPAFWQSLPDRRAADVFALALIMLDIFSFGLKGSISSGPSWSKKASGKDHSAHANLPAVATFIDGLEKNCSTARPETMLFARGVGATLPILRKMLEPEPEHRPGILDVVRHLEDAMLNGIKLPYMHCGGGGRV